MNHWTAPDLALLRRLRERFLAGSPGAGDYWKTSDELALYDTTFAERIGWKWDAVLRELAARAWQPRSRHLFDWGCGSGVASRRLLAAWPGRFETLTLHDRSPLALRFASERARAAAPGVALRTGLPATLPPDTLVVVSHVLNELAAAELHRLLPLLRQAREIIWVEAGTHADSRRLIAEVREPLLGEFTAVAPCTHAARCGMLAPANAPHWCHHFATAPAEIFQDGRWAEFGRELGIDLRALPYAFLVLARPADATPGPEEFSRMIGRPREYKGYSKILSCQAAGVGELMLQKRDAPALRRTLGETPEAPVFRWTLSDGKIVAGERMVDAPRAAE